MKIAHLVPYSTRYPLTKHNGRYEWVLRLARLQRAAGLHPVIYSNPASFMDTPGIEWRSVNTQAVGHEASSELMEQAFNHADIDIYHSHFDSLHYTLAHLTSKPVIATQHWFPNELIAAAARQDVDHRVITVPVTHHMQRTNQQLGIPSSDVIYHGIDLTRFKLSSTPRNGRLLFAGRIAPHKGVLEAVQFATHAGLELDIVGKINAGDQVYWQTILPYVDGKRIRYCESQPQSAVADLMAMASALIFLPQRPEAFGQTVVEAQACGTPVLVSSLGANSELVLVGRTGLLIEDISKPKDTLKDLAQLSTTDCRAFAEQFDVRHMAAAYTELYERLVA